MLQTVRNEIDALGSIIRTLVLVAIGAAIYRELRLPPDQRTWQGRVLGFVPYDFRLPPSPTRLRDAYFNTASDRILSPTPLGVGWAVNLAAVLKRLGVRTIGGE